MPSNSTGAMPRPSNTTLYTNGTTAGGISATHVAAVRAMLAQCVNVTLYADRLICRVPVPTAQQVAALRANVRVGGAPGNNGAQQTYGSAVNQTLCNLFNVCDVQYLCDAIVTAGVLGDSGSAGATATLCARGTSAMLPPLGTLGVQAGFVLQARTGEALACMPISVDVHPRVSPDASPTPMPTPTASVAPSSSGSAL
mmetsp:Transcript_36581/g.91716  ORF Transcript_36581/g.91716 Transcript_36581/m.91716 type:complete len:198 (-) Transcript_36581:80-673(-)